MKPLDKPILLGEGKPQLQKVEAVDGCVRITTSANQIILLDEVDADLAKFDWIVEKKVTNSRTYYYARAGIQGIRIHKLIMERKLGRKVKRGMAVDHINRNGLDNRRCNLREVTVSENNRNREKLVYRKK